MSANLSTALMYLFSTYFSLAFQHSAGFSGPFRHGSSSSYPHKSSFKVKSMKGFPLPTVLTNSMVLLRLMLLKSPDLLSLRAAFSPVQ